MLRWLTDENVPRQIIRLLRERGFDVADIRERGLEGSKDPQVIELARRENRVLVTTDKDFSNIILYPPNTHRGSVVLRMSKPRGVALTALFEAFVDRFDLESLSGATTIVSEQRVRQRTKPKEV